MPLRRCAECTENDHSTGVFRRPKERLRTVEPPFCLLDVSNLTTGPLYECGYRGVLRDRVHTGMMTGSIVADFWVRFCAS